MQQTAIKTNTHKVVPWGSRSQEGEGFEFKRRGGNNIPESFLSVLRARAKAEVLHLSGPMARGRIHAWEAVPPMGTPEEVWPGVPSAPPGSYRCFILGCNPAPVVARRFAAQQTPRYRGWELVSAEMLLSVLVVFTAAQWSEIEAEGAYVDKALDDGALLILWLQRRKVIRSVVSSERAPRWAPALLTPDEYVYFSLSPQGTKEAVEDL